MGWSPLTPSHAIERVRMLVQFRQDVPEKLASQAAHLVSKVAAETRLNGPVPVQGFTLGFQVAPDGITRLAAPQSSPSGWQFVRMSSSGQPLEVLQLRGNQILYETTEYRNWSAFQQRHAKVIAPATKVTSDALDVELVSLEYVDKFRFLGDPSRAAPRDLLVGIDAQVHPDASSGRSMFHVHRGWYEASASGDLLINLNLDAVDVLTDPQKQLERWISVTTKAEARAPMFQIETLPMEDLLDFLHKATGKYFRETIHPSMLAEVGIQGAVTL